MKIVAYIPGTGRITSFGAYTPPINLEDYPVGEGSIALEVPEDTLIDYKTTYVSNETVISRPKYTPVVSSNAISADGIEVLTISGIPGPCSVLLYGPVEDAWNETAGEISLTVNVPGLFIVRIDAFPYQDIEVRFNAA